MKRALKEIFRGPDGKLDEQAVVSVFAAVVLVCLQTFDTVVLHNPLNAQNFGLAMAGFGIHRWAMASSNRKEGQCQP